MCNFDLYLIGVFDNIEHPYQVVIISCTLASVQCLVSRCYFASSVNGLTLFAKLIKGRPDNLFLSSTDLFPTLAYLRVRRAKLSPNCQSVQLEMCTYLNWKTG